MKKTLIASMVSAFLSVSALASSACQGVFALQIDGSNGILRVTDDTTSTGLTNATAEVIFEEFTFLKWSRGRCVLRADGLTELTFDSVFHGQTETYHLWGLNTDSLQGEFGGDTNDRLAPMHISGSRKSSNGGGFTPNKLCQGRYAIQSDNIAGSLILSGGTPADSVRMAWDGGMLETWNAICLQVSDTEAYLNFSRDLTPFYTQTFSASIQLKAGDTLPSLNGSSVVNHSTDSRFNFSGRGY